MGIPHHKIDVRVRIENIRRKLHPSTYVSRQAFPSAPDATLRVLDSWRQGNALRGSRSMPCKQVLLALEIRRERRRLPAACAHDRCAPLLRHHHHRNHQHQRHNHDIADGNGENDHRISVIDERAIDLMFSHSKTRSPCRRRSSVMARRSLGWQDEALRGALRDDKAKPCNRPTRFEIIMPVRPRAPADLALRSGNTTRRPCP